jgi:L-lactate permease
VATKLYARRQPWAFHSTAALPIFVLLYLLGIKRKPAWISALIGLAATIAVGAVYRMPVGMMLSSVGTAPLSGCS